MTALDDPCQCFTTLKFVAAIEVTEALPHQHKRVQLTLMKSSAHIPTMKRGVLSFVVVLLLLLSVVQLSRNMKNIEAVERDSPHVETASRVERASSAETASRSLDTTAKPLFVLHVGPPKTGTSTIQYYASHHGDELEQDNIYYLGHGNKRNIHQLWNLCVYDGTKKKNERECEEKWTALQGIIEYHYNKNHSVFLSDELFAKTKDTHLIKEKLWSHLIPLQRKWNIRVIFAHRRYYEWLVSSYHQNFNPGGTRGIFSVQKRKKWPSQGGRETVSFVDYLNDTLKENLKTKNLPAVRKLLQDNFSTVWTFNMHDIESGDLIQDFYCKMIPEAAHMCRYLQSQNDEAEQKNPSSSKELHFDMIAGGALQRGWIKKKLARQEVTQAVKYFAVRDLNLTTLSDFPLECPAQYEMDQLLNVSLDMEREMVPEFYASSKGESSLRAGFAEAVERRKFCSVDVDEVLKNPRWKTFFKTRLVYNR